MKMLTNLRRAEVIHVIHVVTCEGEGMKESPYREVSWYYSLKGKLLAKRDEYLESTQPVDKPIKVTIGGKTL